MGKKKRPKQMQQRAGLSLPMHGLTVRLPAELGFAPMLEAADARLVAANLVKLGLARRVIKPPPNAQAEDIPNEAWLKASASIATNAWRAKIKMVDAETNEPKEEMKRVYRHIEAIFDALKQAGVETIDPIGRSYDSGMAIKVVSFEQTPGVSKETIKETIKPSVAWKGRMIQTGEVIVATPMHVSSP